MIEKVNNYHPVFRDRKLPEFHKQYDPANSSREDGSIVLNISDHGLVLFNPQPGK